MRYLKTIAFLIVFILLSTIVQSQGTVILQIPKALEVNPGSNVTITQDEQFVLGGDPTAQFGSPPYEYLWTPSTGLSDPTLSNPVVTIQDTITYNLEVTDANGCTVVDEITVNVITIGINEIIGVNDITIYPNPGFGEINIDFHTLTGSVSISCFDIGGKVIKNELINVELNSKYCIDIRSYPSGVYVVKIEGEDFVISKSIIKNK